MWREYLDHKLGLPWVSSNYKNAFSNNPSYSPVNEMWGRRILYKLVQEKKAKGEIVHSLYGGITEIVEDGELMPIGAPEWITGTIIEGLGTWKGWGRKQEELKELITEWYNKTYDLDIDASSEVALVIGGAFGVDAAARITSGPGDEVLIMDPDYVTYLPQVASTGARTISVPLKEENGEWHFEYEELEKRANPRCKILYMSNASNPSGFFYTEEDLKSIAELAEKYDFMVFHDQVAEEFILDEDSKLISMASIPGMKDRTIIASSFSKMYNCHAFRTGWIVANKDFCELALLFRGWVNDGIVKPAVEASLAILREENKKQRKKWVDKKLATLRKKRDHMKKRLSEIEGVTPNTPKGHYWAWPNVSSFGMTTQKLAEHLVKEANVFCRPGTWYGTNGEGHFRLNFSIPTDYMDEALDKVQSGLEKLLS